MIALRHWLTLLSAAFAVGFSLAIIACDLGGNSGSETTNGLAGKILDTEGKPVMGARVRLLAGDFDPGVDTLSAEGRTDAKGEYALSGMSPGRYNLEVLAGDGGHMSWVRDLVVPASGRSQANGMLREPGKIAVRIADFASQGDTGYLYLPGAGAYVPLGAEAIARGEVTLGQIPAGRFDSLVLVLLTAGQRKTVTLQRNLEMTSGELSEVVPFATWAYSRHVTLDTKAMGIAQGVVDFPLLVRLTPADSVFDQAALQGADLRFADAAHGPLAFQIERWDAVARQAEIWVRLDTVRGNAVDQELRMFWGKPEAKAITGDKPVFDPQVGFATVYHLAETDHAAVGGYRDATPLANHATAASLQLKSQVNGVIGLAKSFSGTPTSVDMSLTAAMPLGLGGNSSFTVSFWLRCRMVPQRQGILDFGIYGLQQDMHFLLNPDTSIQFGAYYENGNGAGPASWQSTLKIPQVTQRWTHLSTVYNAAQASLEVYVDGIRADSLRVPAMTIAASGALRIGKPIGMLSGADVQSSVEYPFNGELDEIRFETRALPPERIRLDYLTQRP
jgi:Concanavalin A-like lectin/glucanases superfamily/Carboxypeptidase regulatory-like domain/Domain of unknown function (DUF2341)